MNKKNFDEIVKKESNDNKTHFRFCPVCGSLSLKPVLYGMGKDAVALSPQMKCVSCGFYGFVFEGTPEFIEEFRKKLNKEKK